MSLVKTLAVGALGAVAFGTSAFANANDILIRGRIIGVLPNESASIDPIGGDVDIEDQIVPEVDFTYFFTDNIAVEAIAAVTPHDVRATGTSLGDVDLGDVWLLPPTVTLPVIGTVVSEEQPTRIVMEKQQTATNGDCKRFMVSRAAVSGLQHAR